MERVSESAKSGKGSFVVNVQCRENSTWQGTVLWAEKGVSKPFRSVLELLRLVEGALDEVGEEKESA